MPAVFVLYNKRTDIQNYENFVFSPTTNVTYFTRNVYSDPECTKLIGKIFQESYLHVFAGTNICTWGNGFILFNADAPLPSGNNNVLVLQGQTMNAIKNGALADGTYTYTVNSGLSTGEYQSQIGYATLVRDSTKIYDQTTVEFPFPTVTTNEQFGVQTVSWTNKYNNFTQPNTAPLQS